MLGAEVLINPNIVSTAGTGDGGNDEMKGIRDVTI